MIIIVHHLCWTFNKTKYFRLFLSDEVSKASWENSLNIWARKIKIDCFNQTITEGTDWQRLSILELLMEPTIVLIPPHHDVANVLYFIFISLGWHVVTMLTYLLICFLCDAGGGSLCFPEVWLWPRRVPRRRIIVTLSLFRPFRVMYGLDTETRAQASPIIGPHR